MNKKFETLKCIKVNDKFKVFEDMIGYTYLGYYSDFGKGYVILASTTKEGREAFDNGIYKSLIELGEDEEYAKKVAMGEEEIEGCVYMPVEFFEKVSEDDG